MDILQIVFYITAGIVGGVIGAMGMGGGTLLIPILTMLFHLDQKIAQGINLVVFIPMAVISSIIYTKKKLIKLKPLLLISLPALATSAIFSFLVKAVPNRVLSISFGSFLVVLGFIALIQLIFKKIKNKKANLK